MSFRKGTGISVAILCVLMIGGALFAIGAFFSPSSYEALDTLPTTNFTTQSPTVQGNVAYGAGGYSWNTGASSVSLSPPAYYTPQSNYAGQSNYLTVTGFNFGIPSDATVTGVSLIITKAGGVIYSTFSCESLQYSSGAISNSGCIGASGTGPPNGFTLNPQGSTYSATTTPISDASIKLFYNSVAIGNDHAVNGAAWSTSQTSSVYGGDSDTWGAVLTPQIVNAANFGFGIAVNYNPYPNNVASTSTTGSGGGTQYCLGDNSQAQCTGYGTSPSYSWFSYSYNTNAVFGSITSMSMTVYYNWPYPTVTQTSGLPTTVTVAPVTSATVTQTNTLTITQSSTTQSITITQTQVPPTSTATQTSTVTLASATDTYTLTLTPVTTVGTVTSTASTAYTSTLTQTSQAATTVTSFTSTNSSGGGGIGPFQNWGQFIGVVLGSGVSLIGAGGLGTLLRKP